MQIFTELCKFFPISSKVLINNNNSIGSNRIEKDQGHVSPRPVWGKREEGECDLVYVECL